MEFEPGFYVVQSRKGETLARLCKDRWWEIFGRDAPPGAWIKAIAGPFSIEDIKALAKTNITTPDIDLEDK